MISSEVELSCRRGRAEIIDGQTGKVTPAAWTEPKQALIQTLVQAEFWRAELQKHPSKSLTEMLLPHGVQPAYIRRLINAAYLAPVIKRAIFQGTQPGHLQVQDLIRAASLDWEVQMRELGFSSAMSAACH